MNYGMIARSDKTQSEGMSNSDASFNYRKIRKSAQMPSLEDISEIEDLRSVLIPQECIDDLDIRKVLTDTCHRLNEKLVTEKTVYTYVSGSTGVICVITGSYLFTANVGDSGALLMDERGGILTHYHPIELTRDMKPDLKEERERIEASGGVIKQF